MVKEISPIEVYELHEKNKGFKVLDIREADEFEELCAPISINKPLTSLDVSDLQSSGFDKTKPLYIICRSGRRSLMAAKICEDAGYEDVYNVTGGMIAWEQMGLPTTSNA